MTSVSNFLSFDEVVGIASSGGGALAGADSGASYRSSVERFGEALRLAQTEVVDGSGVLQDVQSHNLPSAIKVYGQLDTEALALENERALAGVSIGQAVQGTDVASAVGDPRGQMILDGLSELRSAFDSRASSVYVSSSQSMSGAERLIQTQVELVKYSLLIDVTSKLVGKSTQAIDTLMKGQ